MKHKLSSAIFLTILLLSGVFSSCVSLPEQAETFARTPSIFPDYAQVMIPPNIAPLNFHVTEPGKKIVRFKGNTQEFLVKGDELIKIPQKKWQSLLKDAAGGNVHVTVYAKEAGKWIQYNDINWQVSTDPIDGYLAYRLIEPTYANWNEMTIVQRRLTAYDETELINNDKTGNNCMNCHTFNRGNPNEMVMHFRKTNPGTLLIRNGEIKKLSTKTDKTISQFVYPYWHPNGRHIAFSTNDTQMSFYDSKDKIIEVYDLKSDIVIYDSESNEVFTDSLIASPESFESFPLFSPDGKYLYFCTSPAVDSLPQNYARVLYSLCRIGFDAQTQTFASAVDTIIHVAPEGKSVSLPALSPDGNYMLCSIGDCGSFMSWDNGSDLYLYDLRKEMLTLQDQWNSDCSDSYTSWSSNSRWIVFSSRRMDGLYNHLYIAHIDEAGNASKPFLLPQRDPQMYKTLYKAYNIAHFIKEKVAMTSYDIAETVRNGTPVQVNFREGSYVPAVDAKNPAPVSEVN